MLAIARPSLPVFLILTLLLSVAQPDLANPPTLDPSYGVPARPAPNSTPPEASWIWAATVSDNQTVHFRRSFNLSSPPKSATLYITADNFFTLFVNGRPVARSMPDPNNGNVWQTVHAADVTPYLRAGTNILSVAGYNTGGPAGLLAELTFGNSILLTTDARWKVSTEPSASQAWIGIGYDDSGWRYASVEASAAGGVWAGALTGWPDYGDFPYLAHLTLPARVVLRIDPGSGKIDGANQLSGDADAVLTVWPAGTAGGAAPSLVLDFGQEMAGRIVIQPETVGAVQVGTGESLAEALNSPWGGLHELSLAPGINAATPYSAFRYARLIFPASAAQSGSVKLRVHLDFMYYPVEYKGSFGCSDPLLTKIWYTGAYTAHLCMQQDIWDAPKRDRARWSGDLNVSGLVIDDVFADRFLMERTLARLREDAQGGRPADQLPPEDVNGIPGYSAAWFCTMADLYRHIGDTAFIRKEHAAILSLLQFDAAEFNSRRIFVNPNNAWTFVDWSPGFDYQSPQSYAATDFFFIRAFRDAAFMLRSIGDSANANKWDHWADDAEQAARADLFDTTTGTYGSRLQENAMAVYSGVATSSQTQAIYKNVLNLSSPAWDHSGIPPYNDGVITPYYGNYILRALSDAGEYTAGEEFLKSYWGGMLDEGATSFWEAYDPYWAKNNFHVHLQADGSSGYFVSLCHGWSSGPTSWLTDQVLGVRPTSGGFATATIAPNLGTLKWAEGTVPTPNGALHVRVDVLPNGVAARVSLPPGVKATIVLAGRQLLLGGKPVTKAQPTPGTLRCTVDHAGDYQFVALSGPK